MHHRIHAPHIPPVGEPIEITGEEFHHASRVVRLRVGERVEVFDGKGSAASGTVQAIEKTSIRVQLEGMIPSRESPVTVTLAMAIIQLEKFELVLQKATELGVLAFIPMVTDRVELRPERYRGKAGRWEKIILEAVKQSGRSRIPSIEDPAAFDDVASRSGTKIFFDADSDPGARPEGLDSVILLVGPEGGWSEREIALARERQCLVHRLGPRRLRAETAAITAAAIIAARYGDI